MSAQYVYFGSGSHQSADLKRVTARVRAAKPEFFKPRDVLGQPDTRAVAMSPAARHRFATEKR